MRKKSLSSRFSAVLVLATTVGCGISLDPEARLERAQLAFDRQEYDAAIVDTRTVLQQQPENKAARLLLGRSALAIGDGETAEKELRRATELGVSPSITVLGLGEALLLLGRHDEVLAEIQVSFGATPADKLAIMRMRGDASAGRGDYAGARELFEAVLAEDPNDVGARLGIAETFSSEGRFGEARELVDKILDENPKNLSALLTSAYVFMAQDQPALAEETLRTSVDRARALGDTNREVIALGGLAEAELEQGKLEAAEETIERLGSIFEDSLATWFLRARLAYQRQDFELAHQELQRILSIDPSNSAASLLMGAVHLERGSIGQAEMQLSRLVAADPNLAEARLLLAEARLRQQRGEEATAALQPILSAAEENVAAVNLAVRASLVAGEFDSAIAYLTGSLERDPANEGRQLDLAAAYLAAGRAGEASRVLEDLEAGTNNESEYRREVLRVMAAFRRDDLTSAYDYAVEMSKRWPTDPRSKNLAGGIALELGRFDDASDRFREAKTLAPEDPVAHINLAQLELRRENLAGARQHYLEALEHQPESVEVLISLAELEATAEDRQATVQWLERARSIGSAHLAPRLLLAQLHIEAANFEEAEAAAREAIDISSTNADSHNLLGLALLGRGRAATAIAEFERAIELEPDIPDYRLNKARAHSANGDDGLAERALVDSGSGDLEHIPSVVALALLRVRQGDVEGALDLAKQLQARSPNDGIPFALEAEIFAETGDIGKASEIYGDALQRRPDDERLAVRAFRVNTQAGVPSPERPILDYLRARPLNADVRLVLADHYQSVGDQVLAIREYERVAKDAPGNVVALNNLAWSYLQVGDDRAEQTALGAFRQAPTNGAVLDTLGWIQVQKENLDDGISNLEKAAELSNGHPDVLFHLAAGLVRAGQVEKGRMILEELVAEDRPFSSRPEASRLLARLSDE